MIKTLTAIGDSLALIIDKPVLDLLNIDANTPLEVRTDGQGLIIRPAPGAVATPAAAPPAAAPPAAAPPAAAPPAAAAASPPLVASPPVVAPPPPPQEERTAPPAPPHAAPGEADDAGDADDSEAEADDELFAEEAPDAVADLPPAPRAALVPGHGVEGGDLEYTQGLPPEDAPERPSSAFASMPEPQPSEEPRTPEVVIDLRGDEVMRVPLHADALVVGRDPRVELHLDDLALSRRHARIERRGAAIWVIDLESANGTFVNGERIREHRLNGGDVIGVGRYRVRLEGVAEARSDTAVITLRGPEGDHRFAMVGDQVVIGRSQRCDIAIGHSGISRRHVRILRGPQGYLVEDLGSANPARLNGQRLSEPTPFRPGDALEVCEFRIELGFLEARDHTGSHEMRRTLVFDRSHPAQAAYMEGEFEKLRSAVAGVAEGDVAAASATAQHRPAAMPLGRRTVGTPAAPPRPLAPEAGDAPRGEGRLLRPRPRR